VHLVDGTELINFMVGEAIGVRQIEMGILDIDENFWTQAAYEA